MEAHMSHKTKLRKVEIFTKDGEVKKVRFPLDETTYKTIMMFDTDHQRFYFSLHYYDFISEHTFRRKTSELIEDAEDDSDAFLFADLSLTPDKFEEEKKKSEALQRAINELTPKQKIVIVGVFFYGRNQNELAIKLRISSVSVNKILKRSLATLKRLLGEDFREKF